MPSSLKGLSWHVYTYGELLLRVELKHFEASTRP